MVGQQSVDLISQLVFKLAHMGYTELEIASTITEVLDEHIPVKSKRVVTSSSQSWYYLGYIYISAARRLHSQLESCWRCSRLLKFRSQSYIVCKLVSMIKVTYLSLKALLLRRYYGGQFTKLTVTNAIYVLPSLTHSSFAFCQLFVVFQV